jgi:hypothetical protein
MKRLPLFAMIAILAVIAFLPLSKRVTVVKNGITENRPFAGVINGEFVGQPICAKYIPGLTLGSQPDTAHFKIWYSPMSWVLGGVLMMEEI